MWTLEYTDFDPARQGLREALCTLGNGYFATRGAGEETRADGVHYPGTYVAGGYNRMKTEIAGRMVDNEDLVNLPNWLPLNFRPEDGHWFDPQQVEILDFRQALQLRDGVLERAIRYRDAAGRITTLRFRRLVHMRYPHLAAIEMRIHPENWSGRIQLRSALDGTVTNRGVERYAALRGDHLQAVGQGTVDEDIVWLEVATKQSRLHVAQAARTRVLDGERPLDPTRAVLMESGFIAQRLDCEVVQGRALTVEKVVALYTSRDKAITECATEARTAVRRAADFEALLTAQRIAWKYYWDRSDIRFDEDGGRMQLILRLHVFHILQTTSMNTLDLDFGIPARGLHGEAYRGHIFWDEVFILPFFNYRLPEITRALLLYRYRRLDAARAAARRERLRGALFPWQSGSNGREETQQLHLNPRSGQWDPDHTHLQRHVNAAIAYNIWHYYQATRDVEFLRAYGAEMLLEIARLWASLASHDAAADRYDIKGVIGPDEYHEGYPDRDQPGIDNNTYTNIMAVWCLCRALETLDLLDPACRGELCDKIALDDAEIRHWDTLSRKLKIVFEQDGIPAQFEGYERLEELDWEDYRRRHAKLHRLDRILKAEGKSPNAYKISKQADLLMLFYLFPAETLQELFARLGYPLARERIPDIIRYYLDRTDHGSTLSRVVHAWVLARSDRAHAWQLFREALESDIADIQDGTTREGIHLGAMAGTVDLVQSCFTGLTLRDDILWIEPVLPEDLRNLRFRLRYYDNWLDLSINHEEVSLIIDTGKGKKVTIGLNGATFELEPNQHRRIRA